MPQTTVQGMNHTLAYRALVEKAIDVTDLYTTDSEIVEYDLLALTDDLDFFPTYEAVWLYRADLEARQPRVVEELRRLEGRISDAAMQRMNNRAQGERKEDERKIAADFLRQTLAIETAAGRSADDSLAGRLLETTYEHLRLVVPSLLAAVLVAVPLGVLSFRRRTLGKFVLAATGIIQTIPSLALLLFMIPVMMWLIGKGTGAPPAIAALFLYNLLPIVRNTYAGLEAIPASLRESRRGGSGLPTWATLWRDRATACGPDDLLAGVRAAPSSTSRRGDYSAASSTPGRYGRPITARHRQVPDVPLMLEGAIPAAILALADPGASSA